MWVLHTADRCIEVNLELEELQRRLIPFSRAHYQDEAVEAAIRRHTADSDHRADSLRLEPR